MDWFIIAQWHQWLRYVREQAPTVEEQQQEVIRQLQIKQLARLADERWANKPSFLDKPQPQNPTPSANDGSRNVTPKNVSPPTQNTSPSQPDPNPNPQQKENPWAKADRRNPGDSWQPSGWTPNSQR